MDDAIQAASNTGVNEGNGEKEVGDIEWKDWIDYTGPWVRQLRDMGMAT